MKRHVVPLSFIAILFGIVGVGSTDAATQVYTEVNGGTDSWNDSANWTSAVPSGADNAVIGAGETPEVNNASTPAYSGTLTLNANAFLRVRNSTAATVVFGGATSVVTMNSNARISMGTGNYTWSQPFMLAGNAEFQGGYSTTAHHTSRSFDGTINGPGQLTLNGVNNNTFHLNVSNSFSALVAKSTINAGQDWRVEANAAPSLGNGDVTIEDSVTLQIDATNAMHDGATLYLNGSKDYRKASKLIMNADDTVGAMFVDGNPVTNGTYDSSRYWITGSGTLTVTNAPADGTAPTVVSIDDHDLYGGPVWADNFPFPFIVTFDEDIDASTVDASDFENGGDSGALTIGTITKTSTHPAPAVFKVEVTPASTGTLRLDIKSGAAINDLAGNPLDTTTTIQGDTTVAVNAGPSPMVTMTGTANGVNGDRDEWHNAANWDLGVVPYGAFGAVVNVDGWVWNADTRSYTGDLVISNNAALNLTWTTQYPATYNALGTPGSTVITMHDGSHINSRNGGSPTIPEVQLRGDARFTLGSSTQTAADPNFAHGIFGPHTLSLSGKGGGDYYLTTSNAFSSLVANNVGSGSGFTIRGQATNSLPKTVTIADNGSGSITATLYIDSDNAMPSNGVLSIDGPDSATKLHVNATQTIYQLWFDGVQQPGGDYTSADAWLSGDGMLTVLDWPVSITNLGAENVDTTTADLVGAFNVSNETFDVLVYWSENDNADASAWLADGTASNMLVAGYSASGGVTGSVSSLTPARIYYFTLRATNAVEEIWAGPNYSFVTLGIAAVPVVTTDGGATNVAAGTAALRGVLTLGGTADAYICWGENDGGTSSTGDWANVISIDSVIETMSFSTNVSGLLYGIEYDYRVYATNDHGDAWSAVGSFTTLSPKGGWSPADTSTALWLDADDASTITLNGGTVSQWDDKSGNGRHVTQANAADQPAYSTDVVSFDGSSDHLWNSSPFMYDNGQVDLFIVASVSSGTDDRIVAEGWSGGDTPVYCLAETHNSDASRMCTYIRNDANSARFNHTYLSAAGAFDGTAKMYQWRDTGTSVSGRVNGGTVTSAGYTRSGAMTLNRFAVGALLRAGAAVHTAADINEIIACDNLSDTDRQLFEGYLTHKWGLESLLPGDHPYASESPGAGAGVSIANTTATHMTATTADLVGTLDGAESVFTVTVYWSTFDNADAAAWQADGTASSMVIGTYTNVTGLSVTGTVSSLVGGTAYYYTMVALNAATDLWATPNVSFGALGRPVVENAGGATGIDIGTATLNGQVVADGGVALDEVRICFGDNDGGTNNPADWDMTYIFDAGSVSVGVPFSTNLTGLLYGAAYTYRTYAANSYGGAWSVPSTFVTLPTEAGLSGTPGLISGTVNGNIDTTTPNPANGDGNAVTNPGPWRATVGGWGGNTTYIYTGQMYFDGTDYFFVESIDDKVWLEIDGTVHMNNGTWNDVSNSGLISKPAGWYDFELRMSNGSGGSGPINRNPGFQYHSGGGTSDAEADNDYPLDPGDGTLFRHNLVPGVGIGIANGAAVNIGELTADLVGTLDATQAVFDVTVYWSTSNNVDSAAWLADGTASSASAGRYTNVMEHSVTGSVSALTGGMTYYYTMRASNAATNMWAGTNASFTTASAPGVDNAGGASEVYATTATLNGELIAGGAADAYICWGTNDMGTSSTGDWDNVVAIGAVAQDEPFSARISGLAWVTEYAYRCYVINEVDADWSAATNFTTLAAAVHTATGDGESDTWNSTSSWNIAVVPVGGLDAVVETGKRATAWSADTPTYAGNLTIESNATLQVGWATPNEMASYNALGSPGKTVITMHDGAFISFRAGGSPTMPAIELLGDVRLLMSSSTQPAAEPSFDYGITGPYTFTLGGKGGCNAYLTTSNDFTELTTAYNANYWAGGWTIWAQAAGSLPPLVTINANASDEATALLVIDAEDAMPDNGTLALNGMSATLLTLNADDTIGLLSLNGNAYPAGTYGSIGANASNQYSWISGSGILTVTNAPADSTPPTVAFVDDQGGNDIYPGWPVTYTVTFSEPVTPDPTTNDFDNAATAGVEVVSITRITDVAYEVVVKATEAGSLQLQVKSGAAIEDLFGNALATPVSDDDTLTVKASEWKGELGVLKPWANGGINPATGNPWTIGDTYHLAFVSSGTRDATDPDIATYQAFVQSAADAVGWGDATWYCILQTWNDPARDVNAPPMTTTNGIVLADGATLLANNGPDLANGPGHTFSITEIGTSYSGSVASGSNRKPGDPNQSNLENGVSWATDGRWWQQYNGAQSGQWHFYAISDTLTILSTIPPAPPGMLILVK